MIDVYCTHNGRPLNSLRLCASCYKKWRYKNNPAFKEKIRINGKRYRERHKDEIRERKERYSLDNIEHVREKSREWWRLNPDKRIDWDLRRRFGITKHDYDKMLETQGRLCYLCDKKKRLCADHNHKTNILRGLICHKCNLGVAVIEDIEWFKKAMEYLRNPPAKLLFQQNNPSISDVGRKRNE